MDTNDLLYPNNWFYQMAFFIIFNKGKNFIGNEPLGLIFPSVDPHVSNP